MKSLTSSTIKTRGLVAAAAALALASSVSAQNGTRQGNPYVPAGADYTITAVQDINDSNPNGTMTGAQVNTNFERTPSIGVTYTKVDGGVVDFGVGLEDVGGNNPSQSTGLRIDYNTAVDANSSQVTLED